MKKTKRIAALFSAAIILLILAALSLCLGTGKAYAAGNYDFTIAQYDVDYTVNADRTMQVTEYTTIRFEGYKSTGHVHLIPVNAGDRVRNLKVYEVIGGTDCSVEYTLTTEYDGYIGADIGDYTNKRNQVHTYKLTYEYAITKPTEDDAIFLNAIGYGWDCVIENANVTLRLPDGFNQESSVYYVGETSVGQPVTAVDGVISVSLTNLAKGNDVTFDLYFNDGVLSTKHDNTPYYFIIIGAALVAALAVVKLLCFNKSTLTPVTNVSAPDEMDPLEMGKLIDNKVDKSDVTSLIYYWANRGNLKIDLSDEKDIRLIRITPSLPESAPEHQKIMFDKLFGGEDEVKLNALTNSFYTTVESVTKKVNKEHGTLYTKKSLTVSLLFAVIGILFMGLLPFVYAKLTISAKLTNFIPLVMALPAIASYILMQAITYKRYKKKKTFILSFIGVVVLSAALAALYVLIVPDYIIETVPKILLCVFGYAIAISSVTIISRTDEYTEKLNHILGFKDFISSAEKDRLETMIEENPELYYNVLPYAQVLGVSDVWEDKFASININPPDWAVGYTSPDLFDIIICNRIMRNLNASIVHSMTARPAPDASKIARGLSGFGGGHFGGGGGFGHGGGGGFGR